MTRTFSFETWNVDLAIIKADRIRKRIIAIRRTIYIICIIHLVWYLLNTIALVFAIVKKFNPLAHISGLTYSLVALSAIAVFHRSVRLKSMRLNTVYLSLTWMYLIFAFSANLVLLALFFGTQAQTSHLKARVANYELDFSSIDLLSSVIYFFIYLVLIFLLFLMRGSIFESRKYNQSIERFMENREQDEQEVDKKDAMPPTEEELEAKDSDKNDQKPE